MKVSERHYRPLASIAKDLPCQFCSHVSQSVAEMDSHLNISSCFHMLGASFWRIGQPIENSCRKLGEYASLSEDPILYRNSPNPYRSWQAVTVRS